LRLGFGDGLVRLSDRVSLLRERRRGGNDEERSQQATSNHERGKAPVVHVATATHGAHLPSPTQQRAPPRTALHPKPDVGDSPTLLTAFTDFADPSREGSSPGLTSRLTATTRDGRPQARPPSLARAEWSDSNQAAERQQGCASDSAATSNEDTTCED
jgi:hypothetical protein